MDVILTFSKMTEPDEYYGVNTIPAIAWALELYLQAGARFKDRTIEVIFPGGNHKEMRMKKGEHEIVVWISNRKIYARARCNFKKECKVNTGRVDGSDREALKEFPWDEINSRAFFKTMTKWLMRMDLDFKTLIRAFNTVCDRRVALPLTTKYGKKFDKFNDYRQHRWPKDATPDNRSRFLEEVLIRVAFWIQSAAQVNALDY
ncbi:MAG: hypothetical protein ACW974_00135 [Candidatus Thorarchaeota archaeon]|jgi:hypothetical protein